jgi:predicted transposase YbfD/YdcC
MRRWPARSLQVCVRGMTRDQLVPLGVFAFFVELPDPRVERTRLHPLMSVLTIALLSIICVGEGWDDMEEFGEAKREWLETFLPLPNGIPSADTFRRVISALDPVAFNACFIAWANALSEGTVGKLVAIDGKTVRHSFDGATGKKALHLVNAWVTENRLALGQLATEEKSNEITAIPRLLELLDIRGATISVDAMGCQREIAAKVIEQGGDYIMGLKGNQGTAHAEVVEFFGDARKQGFAGVPHTFQETVDGSEHGRTEVRRVWATQQVEWFQDLPKWKGLRTLVMVERERTVGAGTPTMEHQYYWTSHAESAAILGGLIRGHWGIENSLHWCLDVGFREDSSRVRADHGPENLALLRKLALNLAKSERTSKRGMQAKRRLACLKDDYLIRLLQAGLPNEPSTRKSRSPRAT